jgi:hypothetical protein
MTRMNKVVQAAAAMLLLFVVGSCSDLNRQTSPMTLVVTVAQILHQIDLATDAPNCNRNAGTISLTAIQLQAPSGIVKGPTSADLNQIRVTRYRVSYQRADGGHLVPAPFVRSVAILLSAGKSTDLGTLVILEPSALNQSPFAALQPANGGRDPETGRTSVTMNIMIEVFGETLAGERVTGSSQMTVDFCIACGGCL